MMALHYKFSYPIIPTPRGSETLTVPLGRLVMREGRTLHLEMNIGSSCGIADDVFAFYGDEVGAWYVTCEDYFDGKPWVHCVFFNDVKKAVKGVIDHNGAFLFIENDRVMKLEKSGEIHAVCSSEAIGDLLEHEKETALQKLALIGRFVSILAENDEHEGGVYEHLLDLHRAIDRVAQSNDLGSVSACALAKNVIGSIVLAKRANIDLQAEILTQAKQDVADGENNSFDQGMRARRKQKTAAQIGSTDSVQRRVFENKVKKGFNTTNVEREFCLIHGELAEAFDAYKARSGTAGEELADVAIYLLGIAEMLGVDLGVEIDRKIAVNEARKYEWDSNGVMKRVDDVDHQKATLDHLFPDGMK